MEFGKLEQLFDVNKAIDNTEKAALSVLSYVQPKEVAQTLTSLAVANSDFARAQVEGFKAFSAIISKSVEEAKTTVEKALKTK